MNEPNSTPRFRPVIRVFVSSTFSNLKAESFDCAQGRLNALQAQAFPRLEQLCARNGFQFQAIDHRFRLRQGYGGQGSSVERSGPGSSHDADLF